MYCPQCATDNLDNASFCRGCGANISLVSQALTGSRPAVVPSEELEDSSRAGRRSRRRKCKKPPSVEHGIKNIFMGIAFVLVALSIMVFGKGGQDWWFWMLIPAFAMLGGGVAELVGIKMEKGGALPAAQGQAEMPAALPAALPQRSPLPLPQRNTGELIPQPPSITEHTTRHLGGELPTKHWETPVENRPKNG
jgi:hypothetical protein